MNHQSNRKKMFPALVAALAVTVIVGAVMVALGANAMFNNNNITSAQAATITETANPAITNSDTATVEDLQTLVSQYQARETQYQAELTQAAEQLSQAKAQVQQYESLLTELQNAGVIQLGDNGQVTVTTPNPFRDGPAQPGQFEEHRDHGGHREFWGDDQ